MYLQKMKPSGDESGNGRERESGMVKAEPREQ